LAFFSEREQDLIKELKDNSWGKNEQVEDNEMYTDVGNFMQSRRIQCPKNQGKRFSRIVVGEELVLSRNKELRLQWNLGH